MIRNFSSLDISASGLAAERARMEVAANNIANANATDTGEGEPFQRRVVLLQASDGYGSSSNASQQLGAVEVLGVVNDDAPFPTVYNPSHPHADEKGMVRMPNVQLPNEMIDMISASRTYEANLKSITLFKEMIEQTLSLLRGGQ